MDSLSKSDKLLLKEKSFNPRKNGNILPETNVTNDRKVIVFWMLLGLLLLISLGNCILTLTVFGVLRITDRIENLEILKDPEAIKFYGDVDLDHLYKRDGKIMGFSDVPVNIQGDDGPVLINLANRHRRPETKLFIDEDGITFKNFNKFNILDAQSKQPIFSSPFPTFNIKEHIKNATAKMVNTNRIVSPMHENLNIRSNSRVHLRGTEGTKLNSREMFWLADQDIYLKTINGSIILESDKIEIDTKNIPIVSGKYTSNSSAQFKLCVCMPQGKLFRVPVVVGQPSKTNCAHITPKYHPCMSSQ